MNGKMFDVNWFLSFSPLYIKIEEWCHDCALLSAGRKSKSMHLKVLIWYIIDAWLEDVGGTMLKFQGYIILLLILVTLVSVLNLVV